MEITTSPVKEKAVKISKTKLPEEVIIDIISRLPVKSVFRAQCLSKNFSSITKDHRFVKAHLRNSTRIRPSIILNKLNHLYLIGCSNDKSDCTVEEIPLHHDIQFSNTMTIEASCEGLVVITISEYIEYTYDCFLCNPITSQCNRIPVSSSVPSAKSVPLAWGFGYCTESEVYKIVRLTIVTLMNDNYCKIIKVAEVFSCGIDQSWRRLDFNEFRTRLCNGITVKGVVYWEDGESRLLAFDLAKEEFSRISVPKAMDRTIMNFNGSLAVCHWYGIGARRKFDLWIMKEKHFASDGVCCVIEGNSWERIYTTAEFPGYIHYSLCLNDRQLLLVHDKYDESSECKVFTCSSCDLERKVIKYIPEVLTYNLFEVRTFVESLVDPLYPSRSTSNELFGPDDSAAIEPNTSSVFVPRTLVELIADGSSSVDFVL